jgi:hypothetical protein
MPKSATWDRCYDFLNIFWRFLTKTKLCKLFNNLITTLIFQKSDNFSPKMVKNRRESSKIAENCDHKIVPRLGKNSQLGKTFYNTSI